MEREDSHPSEMAAIDDSFKKPGAVPFDWEMKPGVPKDLLSEHRCHGCHHVLNEQPPPAACYDIRHDHRSLPSSPLKLKPPPSRHPCIQSATFRSARQMRSDCRRLTPPDVPGQAEQVSSRFFLRKLFRRKWLKKSDGKQESKEAIPCTPDLGNFSRWSMSTRKSLSLFSGSSSSKSSPRSVSDAEWESFEAFF